MAEQRRAVLKLYENDCNAPVVLRRKYNTEDIEMLQEKIAEKYKFSLKRHVHQLFGICKECQ